MIQNPKGDRGRPLRNDERAIIEALLRTKCILENFTEFLSQAIVSDMDDGGMGSIQFEPRGSRQYGKTLADANYMDTDGTPVSISLNIDKNGTLFELDFWKVDFSTLIRYPHPSDLQIEGK